MAALTVTETTSAGLDYEGALTAATDAGDTAINDGTMFLVVANDDSGSHTITVTAQNTSVHKPGFGNIAFSNIAVAVAAGAKRMIGPFPTAVYNNSSAQIAITYGGDATGVTIGAFKPQKI